MITNQMTLFFYGMKKKCLKVIEETENSIMRNNKCNIQACPY